MFQTIRVGFPTLFILLIEVNLSFPSSTFTDDTILYQDIFHIKEKSLFTILPLVTETIILDVIRINNLNILRIKGNSFILAHREVRSIFH